MRFHHNHNYHHHKVEDTFPEENLVQCIEALLSSFMLGQDLMRSSFVALGWRWQLNLLVTLHWRKTVVGVFFDQESDNAWWRGSLSSFCRKSDDFVTFWPSGPTTPQLCLSHRELVTFAWQSVLVTYSCACQTKSAGRKEVLPSVSNPSILLHSEVCIVQDTLVYCPVQLWQYNSIYLQYYLCCMLHNVSCAFRVCVL